MKYGNYPDLIDINRILVIKLRHLGDVLLSTATFNVLKKNFPKASIDAFINKESFPILENNPNISDILVYDRKIKKLNRIVQELKILKNIKKKKYDLVFNLTEGDRGAILAWISGARYKIGVKDKKGFLGKNKIYTHLVKKGDKSKHAVEENLDFIRRIGIFPKKEDRELFLDIPKKDYLNMEKILEQNNFKKGKFILIHPTTRWRFKSYPKMKILIEKLLKKNEKIVITAGEDLFEKKIVEDIIWGIDSKNILNLAGKTSIKELAALIDLSRLLISLDTFNLHIASFLKKKTIVLFGPTDEKIWGPWNNDNATVLYHDVNCRPCLLDGCGGSKIADCMSMLDENRILELIS
ncbi:MAG: hypothetical protein AMS24_00490 [Chlamydiae bacterium SM23_39]|nr:MAG: hypothetical protein AMS24_00490 [Chlamydiae bacterium SM23_39]